MKRADLYAVIVEKEPEPDEYVTKRVCVRSYYRRRNGRQIRIKAYIKTSKRRIKK